MCKWNSDTDMNVVSLVHDFYLATFLSISVFFHICPHARDDVFWSEYIKQPITREQQELIILSNGCCLLDERIASHEIH